MEAVARLQQPRKPKGLDCVLPHDTDTRLVRVLGEKPKLLCLYDHAIWTEGPAWWDAQRTLVFSDVRGRQVLAWREDGSVDVLIDATQYCNGNAIDTDDRMVHCEHGRRGISRTANGRTDMLIERFAGKRLNSPNDMLVARDGAIWFTDPTFGIIQPEEGFPAEPELDVTGVYRWDGELRLMASPNQPNGIAFAPDERTLYISETPEDGSPMRILAFDWDGEELGGQQEFARVERGTPDGFAVDRRGWLWSSSEDGVEVFAPDGSRLGKVPKAGCRVLPFG